MLKQLEASGTGKTDSGGRRRGNVRAGERKEKGEKEHAESGQPGGLRAILRLLSEAHLLAGSLSRGGCWALAVMRPRLCRMGGCQLLSQVPAQPQPQLKCMKWS